MFDLVAHVLRELNRGSVQAIEDQFEIVCSALRLLSNLVPAVDEDETPVALVQ